MVGVTEIEIARRSLEQFLIVSKSSGKLSQGGVQTTTYVQIMTG
jgi:hypothetical protein